MRILLVHNRYQQPGGEDKAFTAEAKLLEAHDHQVLEYTSHNNGVSKMSRPALAKATVWNGAVYRELRVLIHRERPQVVHFHNTFPLISPAAYYAARAEGVPVVQTLHNYRLICPNALLFRDGHVCEDCFGKTPPFPGVVHACYRGDRGATGAVAGMLTLHRAMGTWAEMVDVYIALTNFAREKFVEGGLPAEKIVAKPNFLYPDPGMGEGRGGYALFVGRLSVEKGVDTLLTAWKKIGKKMPLKIVGEGPLESKAAESAGRVPGVEWLKAQPREQILTLMRNARALILPSVCYENFPMVLAEAYAVGLPVIASNIGSLSTLIEPSRTGLYFRPGDSEDLAAQIERILMRPSELACMRTGARAEFKAKYTAERNHLMLMDIYHSAIARAKARICA
jgi:glycosyltransferase involved in cell wall biosynthesis